MTRTTRRIAPAALAVLAMLLAGLLAGGCSAGGGGDDDGGEAAQVEGSVFTESGSPTGVNFVRLVGGEVDRDLVEVSAAIGPTSPTASDLYSFAFDIELNNDICRYEPGSAEFGSALVPTAEQGSVVQVSQSGRRVVVGVTKTGPGPGNGVDSERPVVRMLFRVREPGTCRLTLRGSPFNPQNPATKPTALDSAGRVIQDVLFDVIPAEITGVADPT
jgi:hypothetical protein